MAHTMVKACSKVLTRCLQLSMSAIARNWNLYPGFFLTQIPSYFYGIQLHTCHIFGVNTEVLTTNYYFCSRRAFCRRNASHHWRWSHRYIYMFGTSQEIASLSSFLPLRTLLRRHVLQPGYRTCAQISSWTWPASSRAAKNFGQNNNTVRNF